MAASDISDDARAQIKQLREQVQSLMADRVNPALSTASSRLQSTAAQAQDYASSAREYAGTARDYASDQAEALSGQVKDRPLVAVLIAAAIGYLVGRIAS